METELIAKLGFLMLAVLVGSPNLAAADETVAPRAEEVARAYVAARDVGNIDATMAFFTIEGVYQLTGASLCV
jgi:hypothetical protein